MLGFNYLLSLLKQPLVSFLLKPCQELLKDYFTIFHVYFENHKKKVVPKNLNLLLAKVQHVSQFFSFYFFNNLFVALVRHKNSVTQEKLSRNYVLQKFFTWKSNFSGFARKLSVSHVNESYVILILFFSVKLKNFFHRQMKRS